MDGGRFSGRLRGRRGPTSATFLRSYMFLGSAGLVILFLLYTHNLVRKLEDQADLLSRVFAQFCATTTFPAMDDRNLHAILDTVIRRIDFPLVITDDRGVPLAWKKIGINPYAIPYQVFRELDPQNPPPGPATEILAIVQRMDARRAPVPMVLPGSNRVLGMVHYGESATIRQLKYLPIVQVFIVGVFVFLGYLGYRSVKAGEQKSIWVGMARETAHQLGTPISSLMGWLEILKDRLGPTSDTSETSPQAIVVEMNKDVARLGKISSRFESVGTSPRVRPVHVGTVVHNVVEYFRRRLPRLGQEIGIVEDHGDSPCISGNAELLEWVVENLLKNAVEAIDRSDGWIEIRSWYRPDDPCVEIEMKDNGRGMNAAERDKAFTPGYSSKKRGWGLGLPLARRIVEDYHGGKLILKSSQPGKGTVFRIVLPVG
ncbi:MAG: HAMP domain-containing histidine kinase [Candidatus Eisenbacteria sp.]|nr:HAMP domain-containing histidine kinase [Candidatus Eisenbacteria bacterium]